jgi:hypothetical protein
MADGSLKPFALPVRILYSGATLAVAPLCYYKNKERNLEENLK